MVAVGNLAEYLLEQLKTQDVVRVPASEAEYLDIAPEFPGKLEYQHGEIIAMSLASALHELIVSAINYLLFSYYKDKDFLVTSSNAGLQVSQPDGSYYQPDLMVTKGAWQFKEGSKSIITNPYLVVEVMSPGTYRYDNEDKLPLYKDVPTLHYVVYAAQDRPYLTVYERTEQPDVWLNTDYKTLDSVAKLGDLTLPLSEIYHKITFPVNQ
ncbi:Uma2 family endonuclease [Spirosoma soli]|uniref:Uma2 family endonuclease n=1 Tax=Spirosoma soli TaxID=1770529 RepID=A0ABW5M128_9BACT